jgi:CheY-like chemotaxis protein
MPHKLLLADDSVTIQRVIELTFADEDVQVIAVGDGKQAIERIEAERPDIVLADVGMPERDGYEVAAFVKNTAHLAHIPVLLLTGAFEPVDEQRASAVGCDGVLAKPFEPHMVITRVRELLAGASIGGGRGRRAALEGDAPVAAMAAEAEAGGETTGQAAADEQAGAPAASTEPPPASEAETMAAAPASDRAADASLRISRRTPIAVPGFGAPTPPPESLAALDEYFDRLDAAFATMQPSPAPPPSPAPAAESPDAAAGEPAEAGPPAEAVPEPAGQAPSSAAPEPLAMPAEASAQPAAPASAAEPAAAASGRAAAHVPGIAQAFSALFAAERGDAPEGMVPPLIGPAVLPPAAIDDLVERVTRQVLERMSDRVVRDTVTDVVSRVAERLVRDEIERVKATLK